MLKGHTLESALKGAPDGGLGNRGAQGRSGLDIYGSLEALWAENRKKRLQKVFPGLPARSLKKVPKKSKSPRKVSFWGLFDLFGTSLRLRAGRPGKTFCGFRPEALRLP